MLDQITPIVLTFNEAPNLRRTLDALKWARDIVLVDSHSDDTTMLIASQMPQVRALQRRFDRHQNQWNFALKETGIATEWVLALDADYVLTPAFVDELKALRPPSGVNGYQAHFVYCVYGKPLRGSAYPPVTVLYRRDHATYRQDGHTQRVMIEGEVGQLKVPILHDDRKPLTHWLKSQDRYMRLEIEHLRIQNPEALGGRREGTKKFGFRMSDFGFEDTQGAIREELGGKGEANDFGFRISDCEFKEPERSSAGLGLADRLRKTRVLFPFVIFFYCLFVKGGIRDGWAGVYYAFQRMLAETLLSLYLIEDGLRRESAGKLEGLEARMPKNATKLGREDA